jgi:uncharacterized membrane protein
MCVFIRAGIACLLDSATCCEGLPGSEEHMSVVLALVFLVLALYISLCVHLLHQQRMQQRCRK